MEGTRVTTWKRHRQDSGLLQKHGWCSNRLAGKALVPDDGPCGEVRWVRSPLRGRPCQVVGADQQDGRPRRLRRGGSPAVAEQVQEVTRLVRCSERQAQRRERQPQRQAAAEPETMVRVRAIVGVMMRATVRA